MSSAINTNLNALVAQRVAAANASSLGVSMQRLSSGLRINSAKDDAAGLAISERMSVQIKGTDQAARNINDGVSLVQAADAALASISDNLQRIRELAVQSANSTNSATDRAALQREVSQLAAEIDRVATQTDFNGNKLLDGSFSGQQFQVGANAGDTVTLAAIQNMHASKLGRWSGFEQTTANPNAFFNGWANTMWALDPESVSLGLSYSTTGAASDAAAAAAAWNAAKIPGLRVTTLTNTAAAVAQTSVGAVSGTAILTLNSVNINLNYAAGGGVANAQNRQAATAAINAQTSNTGVVATDTGSGIDLSTADGRNIVTSYAAGTATGSSLSDFGLAAAGTKMGNLSFAYRTPADKIGKLGFVWFQGSGFGATAGLVQGASPTAPDAYYWGQAIANVDISTTTGTKYAIDAADEALATVNSARANLGAAQNRFQSAIANLQNSSDNLSAARSRIVDADFAQETATLSRAQILQQASTAMVAQANQSPQGVLALLR